MIEEIGHEDLANIIDAEKYKKANEFKKEIIATCKKYDFSISHEDGHGGFIITDYDDFYSDWFNEAIIDTPRK